MKLFLKLTFSITCIGVLLTSCKKYDEGPAMSLLSKKARIANTWLFDLFEIDRVDSTAFYTSPGTELVLEKDGAASGILIQSDGVNFDTTNFTGTWELGEKNTAFAMILTDLETQVIDTNWWWIRKLEKKEFWLQEDDNGSGGVEYIKLKEKE